MLIIRYFGSECLSKILYTRILDPELPGASQLLGSQVHEFPVLFAIPVSGHLKSGFFLNCE